MSLGSGVCLSNININPGGGLHDLPQQMTNVIDLMSHDVDHVVNIHNNGISMTCTSVVMVISSLSGVQEIWRELQDRKQTT